ncbi:hypothetical protein BJV74DRAFT_121346 [Russula compacta]|nr:hypothetical protein BJV74DRAFT_121346 [Russula compacta]
MQSTTVGSLKRGWSDPAGGTVKGALELYSASKSSPSAKKGTSAGASSRVEGAPTKGNAQSLANEKFRSTSTNDDGHPDIAAYGSSSFSILCSTSNTVSRSPLNGLSEEQELTRYRPRGPPFTPAGGLRRGSQKPTTPTTPGQTSQPTGTQEQTSQPSEELPPPPSPQISAVKKIKGPQTTQATQGQTPRPTHEQSSQPTEGSTPQSTEEQKSATPQQPSVPKKKNARVAGVTATSQQRGG